MAILGRIGKIGGLGLTQVGSDAQGNALYIADVDDNTSGLYEVGTDTFGNALYSTSATASATPVAPTSDGWSIDNIFKIGQSVIGLQQQQQIVDINNQRLRQGLPPLSVQQTAALRPGISVGLAPDTQQMLIWGGLALLALLAFKSKS